MIRGLTLAHLILQNDQKTQFCKICTLAAKEFPETKVGKCCDGVKSGNLKQNQFEIYNMIFTQKKT